MSKTAILKLYKSMLRESSKFPAYNFRTYALRRIRDGFRESKTITDEDVILAKIEDANKNLEIIKRQVIIGQLYSTDKLVIEHLTVNKA